MPCPEWHRLLDRYCALVQTYSEAVLELRNAEDRDAGEARAHAEDLRLHAQHARLEWEEHERTHGCVRKPVANEVGDTEGKKEAGG